MSVLLNYMAVILIWSTTPLAIKLSSDSVSAHAAVLLRMAVALFLAMIVVAVWQKRSMLKVRNIKIYTAAGLGLFPNMSLVYLAAESMSSGMIAVIFALTPVVSGLMASIVLKEKFLSLRSMIALLVSIVGLTVIFSEQLNMSDEALVGISLMLLSVCLFSMSQVAVIFKKIAAGSLVLQIIVIRAGFDRRRHTGFSHQG